MKAHFHPLVATGTAAAYLFLAVGCATTPPAPSAIAGAEGKTRAPLALAAPAKPQPPPPPIAATELIQTYRSRGPLHLLPPAALGELSIAHFVLGQHEPALQSAAVGAALATSDVQRASFWGLIAQNHGAMGHYAEAADAALTAQRFEPENKWLALHRLVYFSEAAKVAPNPVDQARFTTQADIARNHLKRLDPTFDKEPVCEPLTALTIIIVTAIIAHATTKIALGQSEAILKADTPEKVAALREIAGKTWEVFGRGLQLAQPIVELAAH